MDNAKIFAVVRKYRSVAPVNVMILKPLDYSIRILKPLDYSITIQSTSL